MTKHKINCLQLMKGLNNPQNAKGKDQTLFRLVDLLNVSLLKLLLCHNLSVMLGPAGLSLSFKCIKSNKK